MCTRWNIMWTWSQTLQAKGTPNIVHKPVGVRTQAWKRFCLVTLRSHQPCWHTLLDFWPLKLCNNQFLFLIHPLCSTCYGNLSKLIWGPKSTHLSSTIHDLIFPEHETASGLLGPQWCYMGRWWRQRVMVVQLLLSQCIWSTIRAGIVRSVL